MPPFPLDSPVTPNATTDQTADPTLIDPSDVLTIDTESVDTMIDASYAESLTSVDIKADPILSALAKQQSQNRSTPTPKSAPSFKARPAPRVVEGAGPRMTKSAALRQGLKWDETRSPRREVGFENTPGHKRAGLNIVRPSEVSGD